MLALIEHNKAKIEIIYRARIIIYAGQKIIDYTARTDELHEVNLQSKAHLIGARLLSSTFMSVCDLKRKRAIRPLSYRRWKGGFNYN